MDRDSAHDHRPAYIAINVATILCFIATMVFNALASGAIPNNIFHNTTGGVSNYYYTDITPAGWVFAIWGVIYAWQAVWLVYGLTLICRKTSYGYLYVNPNPIPPAIYITYIFNLANNVTWLVMWDRFYAQYALIFLALTALTLYLCMGIAVRTLYNISPILIREDAKKEIWFTRIFVHNGLAIYATWVSIATLINIVVILIYYADLPIQTSGTIGLAILFLDVVAWFFLDNFVWDRYVRYIITPYAVFIVALVGIVLNNWHSTSSNSILSACLLVIAGVAFVVKIVIMIWRHFKRPLYGDTGSTFYTHQVTYGTLGHDKDSMEG